MLCVACCIINNYIYMLLLYVYICIILCYAMHVGSYDEYDTSLPVPKADFDPLLRQEGTVTLSVKDTGAGMNEDSLKVSHIVSCHVAVCRVVIFAVKLLMYIILPHLFVIMVMYFCVCLLPV